MQRFDWRDAVLAVSWLVFVVGCPGQGGGEAPPTFAGPQKPAGTTISGTVPDSLDVSILTFVSTDTGKEYTVGTDLESEKQFEWALPPGTYEVKIEDPEGAETKLPEPVTVGSSAVTLTIPADLKFSEVEEDEDEDEDE